MFELIASWAKAPAATASADVVGFSDGDVFETLLIAFARIAAQEDRQGTLMANRLARLSMALAALSVVLALAPLLN